MYKFLSIVLAFFAIHSFGVEPEIMDTIHLEEITLYSDVKKFQPGAKIEKLTPLQMEVAQDGGLENLLQRFTPIYVVSNAGGLATIHFRGTAPDHTSINFGGININSLTLGHSNLSNITSFLFDRADLQYGGSSAINGSGAVGGAIYLGQANSWTNGANLHLKYSLGSFNEHSLGAKFYAGNGKWESISKIYSFKKENEFPFKNVDVTKISRPEIDDIQKGASLENKGFLQEFNYQFTPNEFFKSTFWYSEGWQQIQPTIKENLNFRESPEILNQNVRLWNQYKNENKDFNYAIGAGYVHDYQEYDNDVSQLIITDRLVLDFSLKQKLFNNSEAKLGAKYKYIVPDVHAYNSDAIKNEQQFDAYFSYFIQPVKQLKATLNLRQSMVSNFQVPFTPALVADYLAFSSDKSILSINTSISHSYRVPTLNDRFWGDQGNPDLKPEEGINLEGGVKWYWCAGSTYSTVKLNAFYMDIDEWIEWRNYGVWMANNIQRVISKGLELHANGGFNWNATSSVVTLNYSFNPTFKIEDDMPRAPLYYTPKHMGNIAYNLTYRKINFYADCNFTGQRIAHDNTTMKSYLLANAGIYYKMKWKKHHCKLILSSMNLLNTNYQNEKFYAMPGRSFKLSILSDIQIINK